VDAGATNGAPGVFKLLVLSRSKQVICYKIIGAAVLQLLPAIVGRSVRDALAIWQSGSQAGEKSVVR
jgi:hypothetical protein